MASNALYEAPTVDNAVMNAFGMQPGMDRLNLLPRYDKKLGWIAPNLLYQMARAAVSPGVAAHGGYVSPADAVNFAGNVSADALAASALMRNPAPGPGKTLPMTVYHGSPHSFDAFDMGKIGTGEGAQAYGHGLYVAESPGVAKSYAIVPKGQKQLTVRDATGKILAQGDAITDPQLQAAGALDGSLSRMSEEAKSILSDWKSRGAKTSYEAVRPSLYTVDLPDSAIAQMLDWDKPLSEQPESVRRALQGVQPPKLTDGMAIAGGGNLRVRTSVDGANSYFLDMGGKQFRLSEGDVRNLVGSGIEGKSLYQSLSTQLGGDQKASEYLRSVGIPGIKYFDGGSRAAGSGTRNYVVFDDKLLKILKKE